MARPKKNRLIEPPLGTEMSSAGHNRKQLTTQLRHNTEVMKDLARQATSQGFNVPDIAYHLGVTKRTVYLWLK